MITKAASGEHVVVIGAGPAGMCAALLLARRGRNVTLIDKDPTPAGLDDAARWARPGVPHTWQSHAFLARCHALLASWAPDVLEALLAAGVRAIRLAETAPHTLSGPPPADGELVVLGARRAVLDWVLRRIVAAEPRVSLHTGIRLTGLVTEDGGSQGARSVPRVRGVVLADGATVDADLVVDAAGRLSPVGGWLDRAGAARPTPGEVPCGIAYYSRFYSRRDSSAPLPTALNRGHTAGASFDRYSCLVFPADNGTFSVTFGVLPEDAAMRVLRHDDGFDAALRSIPMVAPWLGEAGARPLTRVAVMANLSNRVRPWVGEGQPAALGVLPVGDSAFITNPAHTRGTTLAVLSAVRLTEAVEASPDPAERALRLDEFRRDELMPWFHDSCTQDSDRLSRWRERAGVPAGTRLPGDGALAGSAGEAGRTLVSNGEAFTAASRDPQVWRTFTRLQNLLAMPAEVLGDPTFAERVRAVLGTGWALPRQPAPGHDELVAIATEAVATRAAAAGR